MGGQVYLGVDSGFVFLDSVQGYSTDIVDDCFGDAISSQRPLCLTSPSNKNTERIVVDREKFCKTSV